jgi:segregation and condensation protein A
METNAEAIYGHLLFYRAIIDEGDRSEKIERYMELLKQAEAGEGIAPLDPVDRAVQLVFQLVLSNNFDPWDVNLMEFVRMYTKKMHADEVNFIVAGKLVHMAWSILRMQSQEVLLLHERPEQFELNCADWDLEGEGHSEEPFHSDIVTDIPDGVDLAEAVHHHTSRPVSLVELLDAFDEAKREVEVQLARQKARDVLKAAQERFDGKAHSEDLEKDVQMTWDRILRCGNGPIALEDIIEGGKEDAVTVVVSLLFLSRSGKIALWQDELPYGQVFLEIKIPWDIGTLEERPAPLVPAPEKRAVI